MDFNNDKYRSDQGSEAGCTSGSSLTASATVFNFCAVSGSVYFLCPVREEILEGKTNRSVSVHS